MDEATDVRHNEQVILYVIFSGHGHIKTRFCGICRIRANARQITDGLLDSLRTRFGWQFEGNATSSTDELRLDESEELPDASDSANSDDGASADEDSRENSDVEQHEPASTESVTAATADEPEGDKQGIHPILI